MGWSLLHLISVSVCYVSVKIVKVRWSAKLTDDKNMLRTIIYMNLTLNNETKEHKYLT